MGVSVRSRAIACNQEIVMAFRMTGRVTVGTAIPPLSLALAALLLAGCGKPEQAAAPEAPATPTAVVQPQAKDPVAAPPAEVPADRSATLEGFQQLAADAGLLLAVPTWQRSIEEIDSTVAAGIAAGDAELDAIAALEPAAMTFDNTVAALERAFYPGIDAIDPVDVIANTHPDKAMRDAASDASKRFVAWAVSVGFREDVYNAIKAYADTKPELEGEQAKLLDDTLRDYRRNGMHLPKAQRDELERLKTELSELTEDFGKNINEADIFLEFSAAQLDGAAEDFLANPELKTEAGNYRINANVSWQRQAILENVRDEDVRRQIAVARFQRAIDSNLPLVKDILSHRVQIAELLGYASWADYRTEDRMAKNAATALAFQEELASGLESKFREELEVLRQMKAGETGQPDVPLNYWDLAYYENQLKKTRYNIDTEQLKVFFEMDRTLQGMFAIFEELFDITITEVAAPYKWVDDLRLYAISDNGSGLPLGLIYMDLYPREGKYNHFAQFRVLAGKRLPDGRSQRPVAALICNFPPATGDKPSLLKYGDVETLFHEFGHAMHTVLSQASYASFFGTAVERDFVEAPSQMLEYWVRDKTVLDRFAADYRDPERKIPAEVLDSLEEARLATIANFERGQLAYSLIDMRLHTLTDPGRIEDVVAISNAVADEVFLAYPEDTAMIASFGHLAHYDAGYYGYAWARAIAEDMASVFRNSEGGFMDPGAGRRLRDEIYAPGGSRDAEESIRGFLGRERSLDPFFESIGLQREEG